MYIFYDKNLKVMGMSDDANSMQFPYIESVENYHSSMGFYLIEEDGKIKVKDKLDTENAFIKERRKQKKNKQFLEYRSRIKEGKIELIKNNKITIDDLKQFILKYL